MSYLPSKRDFRGAKEIPKNRLAAGLLLLEQKDGAVFALEQSEDLQKAYQSALPRREGYWTRAKWLLVPDRTERAELLVMLTLCWAPKRVDSRVAAIAQAVERLSYDG